MGREALRSLLRHKRSLIDPVELGRPRRTGRGRRPAGLSQAQVAHTLYVSERTYAQLERGDMPSPAPEFLDAVSTVLRMFPRRERAEPELPERNVMRWTLLREEAREHHLLDWAERWAAPVAAQLRAAVAAHPDNPDLRRLDAEVNDAPAARGLVALCAAQPLGSPGARFFHLVFRPVAG
ncbi:helix-turn-helix domain-containing protein [Streptomyces malaysiense]|uniref:HTH cro/C1-type domain-containing protein n=1 Tax=Streptomyces malaysiense TaxID=1428626 RepID=A0A1J4Q573_9ACTN|nr:helix-turn-helix transcriptional regulator [Streptomyces malaysiense]OIK28137.1 hypothetical protein VT52_007735 [Streptomyces malaysiense]